MKTAEEWQKRYWELRENRRDIHHLENNHQWDILIKEIQLDAYKAGMTESADICWIKNREPDNEFTSAQNSCRMEILHARDNKTEI